MYEDSLGSTHLWTAHVAHCLGITFVERGKLEKALDLYKRALNIYENFLRSQHSLTLSVLFSLDFLYCRQQKFIEAEKTLITALKNTKRHFDRAIKLRS
jgi:tetratricopeptide (TPR) repeat protein